MFVILALFQKKKKNHYHSGKSGFIKLKNQSMQNRIRNADISISEMHMTK